jgi:hypothetical protein
MFNHTKVSNNDVHAFQRIPCSLQYGVAVQSAKHLGKRLRFTCSHFRENIYVQALLPRPHMPGQICPRAASRKVTNHNGIGLAGGGRGGGEGRNRALTEKAESAQRRGRVSEFPENLHRFLWMVKHDYQSL